jgi:hypothetical protein
MRQWRIPAYEVNMSHFLVTVILPKKPKDRKEAQGMVETLLTPYCENNDVPEYMDECWCVGRKARDAVSNNFNVQKMFEKIHEKYGKLGMGSAYDEKQRRAYRDELDAEETRLEQLKAKLLSKHPLRAKANRKCDECKGTGKIPSTRNPKSKWDYWTIGGRWTGAFSEYEPDKDPDNIETCWLCNGTGKRNDAVGKMARLEDPKYTCNGCRGTGKKLKWPTEWKSFHGDVLPIAAIPKEEPSFALVTPSGRWHERATMGWFGCSYGAVQTPDEWKKKYHRLLKNYKDNWAVAVDCHI